MRIAATGRRWRAAGGALALATAVATLIGGCFGEAGDTSPEVSAASCAPVAGVTADEVRFGALYPDTGTSSQLSRAFRAGVDARLGEANAAGGVHGRQVRYDWRDDESTSAGALLAARSLVERSQSFAVVGTSGIAGEAADYLAERGVPTIGQDLTAGGENVFGYSNMLGGDLGNSVFGVFAHSHGATRAVILRTDALAASGQIGDRLARSLRADAVQVVDTITWTSTGFDLAAAAERVRAAGADMITGVVPVQAFADVVAAARAAGVTVKVAMQPVGYDPGVLDRRRTGLAGSFYLVDFLPFEAHTPAHQRYLDAMAQYAPQIERPEQTTGLVGWLTADLFLRGLQEAGQCPTRAGYIAALRAVKDYDAGGLLPGPVDLAVKNAPRVCVSVVRVGQAADVFQVQMPMALCGDTLR
ncbi:ABC-type branched-chain amino acid transport system, substrate-binding protein [Parafrankia irregularis]|uniref:ABC-type branched-chain amino acid transport system, substrate-binding protein n=1 Tax=Parafrankia irregularis TaxID=795642 RepID=A0A0S4QN65_9ACTN|nr:MULTISPECIES: ABC transporter substrate-binding protein [Parafrankia]MBE3202171.1 ABC transporter substrate-binding protein [Parafrankia sp. CH37]CUU55958.1 ABC-type branched-chain amino acid transport system, substrate-binding protein [Parafrankia irregularis]